MYCEFSETQFAFGILHELLSHCKGWMAPRLPTQREEKELGYDCKIPGRVKTIFFQFKIPEKKTTSRGKYWAAHNGPYYEFKIWPDNRTHQHNKLVNLEKSDSHYKVYYCSPGFSTNSEFDENYVRETISKNSIYVRCATLPEIKGSDKHSISYTIAPRRIYKMHSHEESIQAFDLDELIADVENVASYEYVGKCLRKIAEDFSIDVKNVDNENMMETFDETEMFDEIANYLLIHENLVLILIGENLKTTPILRDRLQYSKKF